MTTKGGDFVSAGRAKKKKYAGKMTPYVFFTCIIAATGGLMFGYEIPISGGVTSMDPFLSKFFPSVHHRMKEEDSTGTNRYCTLYTDTPLTLFTSSLYLAALVASFFASWITRRFGRKISILVGGALFLAGAAISGAANDVVMLIIGRVLLGAGLGFTNQSVPIYLSEMAPANHRRFLNMFFQHMIAIGIFGANLINYRADKIKGGCGWRVSLAGAAVPAAIITIGSLFLPDTPNSLIERYPNNPKKAQAILHRIRGTDDVEEEFNDLLTASIRSNKIEHPWLNILNRRYRPQLIMTILIPFFQQMTGINVIMFYTPELFRTIGLTKNHVLYSTSVDLILGLEANYIIVTLFFTSLGKFFYKRASFFRGSFQMLFCQIAVREIGIKVLAQDLRLVVLLMTLYVFGFADSWGPLGWLVPSEIFPLEIRSAGQSINVSVNMLFTFLIAQAFPTLSCRFGISYFFYFFPFWLLCMTAFPCFFLPDTKNVPIEKVVLVWKRHWFWGKFIPDDDVPDRIEVDGYVLIGIGNES